jgi:hypothetical protein
MTHQSPSREYKEPIMIVFFNEITKSRGMNIKRCFIILFAIFGTHGCGDPPPVPTPKLTTMNGTTRVYPITVAKHKNIASNLVEATLKTAFADATDRWKRSTPGNIVISDYSADVKFTLSSVAQSFTTSVADWHEQRWNVLRSHDDFELLCDTTDISEWARLVTSVNMPVSVNGGPVTRMDLTNRGVATINAPRLALTLDCWYKGEMWAHELGHNGGCPDRSSSSLGYEISIMRSDDQFGFARYLADHTEASRMMHPLF